MAEVVLIDRNAQELEATNFSHLGSEKHERIRTVGADFQEVNIPGDVAYFELCLHEMDQPQQAIIHAQALAPDVVIFEHTPDSEGVFHAAEEDKVRRSTEAVQHFNIRRRESFRAQQAFKDYLELAAKLRTQGDLAMKRAGRFLRATDIVIPMSYELLLL